MEIIQRGQRQEQTFMSSEAGRRSTRLRERAQELQRSGRDEEAFALYREAADCFPADDVGAAAAAAWHDLGEAHRQRLVGSRRENLLEAERLLRRALASPMRADDLRRRALSMNSLASTLRSLAEEIPARAKALFVEARALLSEAIAVSERFGALFANERARFIDTLSNLELQLGAIDNSIALNRKAIACAQEGLSVNRSPEHLREWTLFKAHLIRRLVARGRRTDLREAVNLAAELRRHAHPSLNDFVCMCEAASLRALGGATNLERASALLRGTHAEGIPTGYMNEYIDLLAAAGCRDLAIVHVRDLLQDALSERRDAKSDYRADHASSRAYEAGRRLAKLHLDRGEPIEAFLALENASGLRYEDSLKEHAHAPTTPLGCALARLEGDLRTMSAQVDDMAGVLAHLDDRARAELLDKLPTAPTEAIDGASRYAAVARVEATMLLEELPRVVTEARSATDPSQSLRSYAERLARRAKRASDALREREPETEPTPGGIGYALTAVSLRELLSEHPGTAFLRVSLGDVEMIAISCFLDGDELRAQSARLRVPRDLSTRLRMATDAFERLSEESLDDAASAVDRLTEALVELNFASALPDRRALVLLPDRAAAMLPLGGLGPRGSTLIERFDSIAWLPCLGALRSRQIGTAPRSGQVTLIPAIETGGATVLTEEIPGERVLLGDDATRERLEAALRAADVLCFYTHGRHGDGVWPTIALADGTLEMSPLEGAGWQGLERVEIWACESGVDVPSDPRGALTNEFFGFDGVLLQHGVRSAIGTLWQVSDGVTTAIVKRYRHALARGRRADEALCEAQRWWIEEGLDEALGPEPSAARRIFECPTIWAGYRLSGVCERRPRVFAPTHATLTSEEEAALEGIIAGLDEHGKPLSTAIEEAIDELSEAVEGRAPTFTEAMRAARLYRARLLSSHTHNLLAALAWLHEAARHASAQERHDLHVEAARVWSWLSLLETPEAPLIMTQGPTPPRLAARGRAARILARLRPSSGTAERAMLRVLHAVELEGHKDGEPTLGPLLSDALREVSSSLAGLDDGGLAAYCWIASTSTKDAEPCIRALRAELERRRETHALPLNDMADNGLLAWCGVLLTRGGDDAAAPPAWLPPEWLPAPALIAGQMFRLRAMSGWQDASAKASLAELSEALVELEGRLWDHPQGDGERMIRSTGTAGPAYRRFAGWYLRSITHHEHPDRYVESFVASLHFFCDLRLITTNRLTQATQWMTDKSTLGASLFERLAELVSQAERRASQLEAAALLPAVDDRPPPDPFEMTSKDLRDTFESLDDAPFWEIAQLVGEEERWTAAYCLVRDLEARRRQLTKLWRPLVEGGDRGGLWRMLRPSSDLEFNVRALRDIPSGVCLLACAILPPGEVVVTTTWRSLAGFQQRVQVSEPSLGFQLRHFMTALIRPDVDPDGNPRTNSRSRREPWRELSAALQPLLSRALGDVGSGFQLAVLAPGCMRPLPWLRLSVGDKTLADRFSGVWQLPALGWWPCSGGSPGLACWLSKPSRSAAIEFGERVVRGLRAQWPPNALIGVDEPVTREIPEASQLEDAAESGLRRLRVYGVGLPVGLTDSTSGLELSGQRAFIDRNTANTRLAAGSIVELWASTPSLNDLWRTRLDTGDRVPGLARSFLAQGAVAVLDLAWPIPDAVKALVCEHYSLLRESRTIDGAEALAAATRWFARLASALVTRKSALTDSEAVLNMVDDERRRAARTLGVDASRLIPLAHGVELDDHRAWIDDMSEPSHLAAFRWWGACALGPLNTP